MFNIKTNNPKLKQVIDNVEKNRKLQSLWIASTISSVHRLGMHDHGRNHAMIVAEYAMALLECLNRKGKVSSIIKHYKLNKSVKKFDFDYQEDQIIVFLASCLHDVGMSVHNEKHSEIGVYLANELLEEILEGVYGEEEKAIVKSEVLHCILSHHNVVQPLTMEASIVKVADSLDMPANMGAPLYLPSDMDTKKLSALAIEKVEISTSDEKPVVIEIVLKDIAGVMQIKSLISDRLKGSALEKYVKIIGIIKKGRKKEEVVFEL